MQASSVPCFFLLVTIVYPESVKEWDRRSDVVYHNVPIHYLPVTTKNLYSVWGHQAPVAHPLVPLQVVPVPPKPELRALDFRSDIARLNEPIRIAQVIAEPLFSDMGVVKGIRQCGNARSVKWRLEFCNSCAPGPCVIPVNQFQRGEITFEANKTSRSMGVLITTMDASNGRNILGEWKNPKLEDSCIHAGKKYAVTTGLAVGPELQGKVITQRLSYYSEDDQKVEACIEAEFLVV